MTRPSEYTPRPAVGPWAAHAACAGLDTDDFFPVDEVGEERAKEVCARCPESLACLDHAMRHKERFGVWGGMTEDERRAFRAEWTALEQSRLAGVKLTRPYGRARCGTLSGYNTHKNAGQPACDDCKQAMADYKWSRRNGTTVRPQPVRVVSSRSTDYDPAGVLDHPWYSSGGAA